MKLKFINSSFLFVDENGVRYKVAFKGVHGNLTAEIFRGDDKLLKTIKLEYGHANKTQAERLIKTHVL